MQKILQASKKATIVLLFLSVMAKSSFGPTHAFGMNFVKHAINFQKFDYVNGNAPKKGTLRLSTQGSFNNLNPFILDGNQASGLNWTYETLGMSSFDEENTIYGLIAKTFSYDDDEKTFTIELRKDAKFNDQSKVTSEDVAFTYQILTQKGHPIYKQIFQEVKSVETPNQHKIIFVIKKNSNTQDILYNIAKLPVLSKKDLETRDFEKTTLKPLITTGPYKIKNFRIGQKIHYSKDENYWGEGLAINTGRNNFEHIIYKYFKDQNIALTAFKAHQYDWRLENISKFWKTQYKGDDFENGNIKKENIRNKNPDVMQAFAMNLRKQPFNDIAIRKALTLAFNFEWFNQNLFYNSYIRCQSFFPNSHFAAREPINDIQLKILTPYEKVLPQEIWQSPFKFAKNPNHTNLQTAQEILDSSDWKLQGRQRVNQKTGQILKFTLLLNSSAMQKVALPYQKQLKKIGIRMDIQLLSPSDWISRIQKFNFDMTTFNWSVSNSPVSQPFLYWHSSQKSISGSNNIIGMQNSAVDDITEKIKTTENMQEKIDLMQALDRILMWNYTVIPHWYIDYDRVAYWTCISPPKKHPSYGIDLASWYSQSSCEK